MNNKEKQFVVIGLGRFGTSIAKTLAESGCEVLVIDRNEEAVQDASEYVTHAVQADVTDIDVLKSLGIRNFDVGVVAIGTDMQSSIMTTLLLKELGVGYVLAKAQNEIHKKVLEKIGADRIVLPEREMGVRIATNLISGNILDYIELSSSHSIVEIKALKEWIGRNLRDINMRAKYGINVIAIKSNKKINVSPRADDVIKEEDVLVVIGGNTDIQRLENSKK
ncbi:potassium channel family protein [Defluviitalea phaphyphila]|uniref:potassium channel family protein n=1 Tax=Defluviitalea phaphyphila TaxID=1473580 RepID=UPI0007317E6B|nr:TrkA family potassium uptake protein [Defluviitalea phaphyphila]